MTLNDVLTDLAEFPPEAELVFTANGTPIHGGYHVTEFQVAQIRSMTCGGDEDAWDEARIQLLDGHGTRNPMAVGKFRNITARVLGKFPEMADLPLSVEFAPDNEGLGIYRPDTPFFDNGTVTLPLRSGQAVCKAALATTSCCGAGACC